MGNQILVGHLYNDNGQEKFLQTFETVSELVLGMEAGLAKLIWSCAGTVANARAAGADLVELDLGLNYPTRFLEDKKCTRRRLTTSRRFSLISG